MIPILWFRLISFQLIKLDELIVKKIELSFSVHIKVIRQKSYHITLANNIFSQNIYLLNCTALSIYDSKVNINFTCLVC